MVEGASIAGYRFDRYKTVGRNDLPKPPRPAHPGHLRPGGPQAGRRARGSGDAVNRARDLQHMPPNELGPEEIAERAREIAAGHSRLRCRGHDERGIARLRMGAFLRWRRGAAGRRG